MGKAGLVVLLLLAGFPAWAQAPITAYCGGGVTGGGSGMRIAADGTLSRIRQIRAASQEKPVPVGSDTEAYRRWNAALDAAGFDRMNGGTPGSMTCSLQRGTVRLIWANPTPPPSLPVPVAQVFRELRGWRPAP